MDVTDRHGRETIRSTPPRDRQPYLHDLVTAVHAPGLALSGADGQIRAEAHGLYRADRRLVSVLEVLVSGVAPLPVRAATLAADRVLFLGALRELGDAGADPTVFLERVRTVGPDSLSETFSLVSYARQGVDGRLELRVASDLAPMSLVKAGDRPAAVRARVETDGVSWTSADGTRVELRTDPAPEAGVLAWPFTLGRGERFTVTVSITSREEALPVVAVPTVGRLRSDGFSVHAGDHRLTALTERSIDDLDSLTLADPLAPEDRYLAAGAPWFLTLFGRDSIWAARMLLPLGTELAAGTLRTLARRQGVRVDIDTGEEPGKIMHESRRASAVHARQAGGRELRLPPLYYGTVDATPLWIALLHDAWRWGMPADRVAALLPAAERALDWMDHYGLGESGFVTYRDVTGRGLANQGWKDSGDSVQFGDGSLAKPPIALCEVQGYAYAAAGYGAELLDAFGRPGAERWRHWAAGLADRFRASFWVEDAGGAYPAIALDVSGEPVDTLTSNMGHLLGTGLLDAAEQQRVVTRLASPDLAGGYGLRTMSAASTGFNPLAYHGGSIWAHDTAIAIGGLASVGSAPAGSAAVGLIDGLLAAAPAFDYRLPELFGGHSRAASPTAVPYPAACRPQAWSAAAAAAVVTALLGLNADVPAGVVRLAPLRPSPVGEMTVRNLRVAGNRLDVHVAADGSVSVPVAPPGIRLDLS